MFFRLGYCIQNQKGLLLCFIYYCKASLSLLFFDRSSFASSYRRSKGNVQNVKPSWMIGLINLRWDIISYCYINFPLSSVDRPEVLYNLKSVCRFTLHMFRFTPLKSFNDSLYFVHRYFSNGMNVSFVSRIIPQNLYTSTVGISVPQSFNLGSLGSNLLPIC